MIRLKFWEAVYCRKWTDKSVEVLIHSGRFLGFAWNIGNHMTFKVLQCNDDPPKRNVVVHRGVVVPHSLTETGYNSDLAPKSYAYFPGVQVEGGATSKTVPLEHQGTVDPPDITITGGGGGCKPLSSSPKIL